MNKLTYSEWLDIYANRCLRCHGTKTIIENDIKCKCPCQDAARRKFRLEQIEIEPAELKHKNWADFNGIIKSVDGKIVGHLKVDSAIRARNEAFNYCFDHPYAESVAKTRFTSLTIHSRLRDGKNLVIAGDDKSGRSFLAILVLKEVSCVPVILRRDVEYQWVSMNALLHAARWNNEKAVDELFLERLSELDFLFIDGIGLYRGGHNSPPDHISMDRVFRERRFSKKPTIFTCSRHFFKALHSKAGAAAVIASFGEELYTSLVKPENVFIELIRDE